MIISCASIDTYTTEAQTTAIYPEVDTGSPVAISYVTLGLNGEAGEVAEKVKKWLRDSPTDSNTGHPKITKEIRDAIQKELGDVAWYWAMIHKELKLNPAHTLGLNIAKLATRQQSNSLGGSGDNR